MIKWWLQLQYEVKYYFYFGSYVNDLQGMICTESDEDTVQASRAARFGLLWGAPGGQILWGWRFSDHFFTESLWEGTVPLWEGTVLSSLIYTAIISANICTYICRKTTAVLGNQTHFVLFLYCLTNKTTYFPLQMLMLAELWYVETP